MINEYTITLPSVNREVLETRLINWLSGIGFGLVSIESAIVFYVKHNRLAKTIVVGTDSIPLMDEVRGMLSLDGVTVTP